MSEETRKELTAQVRRLSNIKARDGLKGLKKVSAERIRERIREVYGTQRDSPRDTR